ncbi:mannose-binding protein [Streptomyces sp. NPDC053728]|uniref:mannose-binding protein n=1 Tax=unclassified Streptomyces TaxID=2593676 RepID=UPI00343188AC
MSPQHPAPGSNAAAAAAPDEQESGPSGRSSPPAGDSRSQGSAPEAEAEPGTSPAAVPEPGTTPAPEPEPGSTPAGDTAADPSRTTTGPTGAPEPETGAARAAGAAPRTRTGTGVDGGRPRAPMLAGAAVLGAVLIAVPLLLVGSANDDRHGPSGQGPAAGSADTVLGPGSGAGAIDDYVAGTTAPTPDKGKPQRTAAPKSAAPAPVAPAPEPEPKPKASSRAPSKKPEPKAAPKPDWTTVTVSAPSVLEVDQAWTTNRIRMVMQPDGNLVVLNEESKPIWASMTFGENHRAIFQPDGNLVIHNGDDRPIWASKTHDHPGAQLVLRADAKVAVVDGGRVIWST